MNKKIERQIEREINKEMGRYVQIGCIGKNLEKQIDR